jgi:hypothetical protein
MLCFMNRQVKILCKDKNLYSIYFVYDLSRGHLI